MSILDTPLIAILGPTASGKSAVAVEVAKKLNGEIISCDSMQIYRQMSIGTAKIIKEEMDGIPHHLIDCKDISERYDASLFIKDVEKLIKDISSRGKLPIITGGTGMYARLLLYGGDMLPSDKAIAKKIREQFAQEGLDPLIAELHQTDPASAEKHAKTPRRIFRALEVVRITGEALPGKVSWHDETRFKKLKQYILIGEPDEARTLIRKRTKIMLEQGWIEEVQNLLENHDFLNTPTACQSLGYREIIEYLNGGFNNDIDELYEKLVTQTCRYAKKQRTWFRNQHHGAMIIPRKANDSLQSLVDIILDNYAV